MIADDVPCVRFSLYGGYGIGVAVVLVIESTLLGSESHWSQIVHGESFVGDTVGYRSVAVE